MLQAIESSCTVSKGSQITRVVDYMLSILI